jgi:hypothetical protein
MDQTQIGVGANLSMQLNRSLVAIKACSAIVNSDLGNVCLGSTPIKLWTYDPRQFFPYFFT